MAKLNKEFEWEDVAQAKTDRETTTIEVDNGIGVTAAAFLVEIDGDEVFIPRGEISEADEGDMTVEVSTWLCEKKGWI